MPPTIDQLTPGSLVGDYRIDELIGRGGMGMIYRATDRTLERTYALKVLAPEVAHDQRFRQRFRREMRLAASFRHPNVVAVHDADEDRGLMFLVMDYVRGTDLARLIRQSGPIEPQRATALLTQVASALDAAHARGLVHRDVKPANILISETDGREHARLTDFGLAKTLESESSIGPLTTTGVVVGTVDYLSPEQITGHPPDARADIYALGCVFFEMLTGHVPYERDNSMMATLFAHVHEPPPPLEGRLGQQHPDLTGVISRAMAKARDERYASAGDFAHDAAAVVSGTQLWLSPGRHATRTVVTVMRCQLLSGDHMAPAAFDRWLAEVRTAVSHHGGTVRAVGQDDVMAMFGIPRSHEDDALRAARAAAEIRARLPAVARELGLVMESRASLSTGVAPAERGEPAAAGDPVSVSVTLLEAARPGDILLGVGTLTLVRDAVEVEPGEPIAIAGASEPLPVFRLLTVDPIAPGVARRSDTPLVDRARELRLLQDAWTRTVDEGSCHLFTLLGEAGVGKSRLVTELLGDVGETGVVLRGRCLPYGDAITFWPLAEAFRPLGGAARPVLERLRSARVATPEELFLDVRRFLESLAAERPVVLHIDDVHWAEPMLLDLVDHIADLSRTAPLLVLCAARPDLVEDRPGWSGGKLNATTALLRPLATAESETLMDQLAADLDPRARARVLAAGAGNPLFLQELVALTRERGTVAVPGTLQALLAERLDRLGSEEREVLERCAIEGEVFHRRGLLALLSDRLAARLDSLLSALVRKELIRPHAPSFDGEEGFRFRHLLIRDAAYDALPMRTRAQLHERFAGWLEDSVRDVAGLDEIAGWHLEQAVRCRDESGQSGDPALALRAANHLHGAGRRARDRGGVAAARNLFERAFELVPADEMPGILISVDLAATLVEAGDVAHADELLSAAELDPDAGALAALTRFEWLIRVRPGEATEAIESKLPGILRRLGEIGDESGMARAHLVASMPHWLASQWTLAGEQARLAAEHAHRADDEGLRSRALAFYIGCIVYGQADTRTIAQGLDAIELDRPSASLAARVALGRGQLARLEGRFDEARQYMQRGLEGFQALGMPELEAACHHELGVTELAAGRPAAALARLRQSDAILAELGQHSLRSTTQALVAQTHELLGNRAEARAAIDLAERLCAPEDVLTLSITQRVRAKLALADGDTEAADRWARSAVAKAFQTDSLIVRAEAKLDRAHVLAAVHDRAGAISEARAALDLFRSKGERPGYERTRILLGALGAAA